MLYRTRFPSKRPPLSGARRPGRPRAEKPLVAKTVGTPRRSAGHSGQTLHFRPRAAGVSVWALLAKRRRSTRCSARVAQRTSPEKGRNTQETANGKCSSQRFFTIVRGASVSFLECDEFTVQNVDLQLFVAWVACFLVYDDFPQVCFF